MSATFAEDSSLVAENIEKSQPSSPYAEPETLSDDKPAEKLASVKKPHRRRRHRHRRQSTSSLAGENNADVVMSTSLPSSFLHHDRRTQPWTGSRKSHETGSPALQSIQDIISEMKRLPMVSGGNRVSHKAESTLHDPSAWSRTSRRHSEPAHTIQRHLPANKPSSCEDHNEDELNDAVDIHGHDIYLHLPQPTFAHSLAIPSKKTNRRRFSHDPTHIKPASVKSVDKPLPERRGAARRARSRSVPHDPIESSSQNTAAIPQLPSQSEQQPPVTSRRALYPPHLTLPEATKLIKAGTLYSGTLNVNSQDSSDAYVACDELKADIYVYGSRNRNRALDGDIVAVELVDVDTMLAEKVQKKQARAGRRNSMAPSTSSASHHPLQSIPEITALDSSPGLPLPPSQMADRDGKELYRPDYCGKIVCILKRPRNLLFSGTLSLLRPSVQHRLEQQNTPSTHDNKKSAPKIIWFIPADKRLPLVAIPTKHAPAAFIRSPEEYKNRTFTGHIQRWPATSLHPFGIVQPNTDQNTN
ncbi:uncharacterized protein BYT42DRAFT_558861 [Radiomyces spectabilis]|uniref:uncharacterized protein n=1 Tax=Radiomyces spectabilis TaxID=64574 RepID=UPI00221FBC33|nr:uncharacterized protein BYT42DRAFT_558861 [Radiomyces spectabilis]KAI8388075.1 hypothetical protein BYT42DRAFT_558861 [Radiomyces spectabilis]